MFWHGSGSDGCRAVPGCFTCHADWWMPLFLLKQSNTALAVLPANAMVLQRSPESWHRSTFPGNLYLSSRHLSPTAWPVLWVWQGSAQLSPPRKRRSFPRLSSLCEINGQWGMDAVLLADWDCDPSLLCSFKFFSSHTWRCQYCLGFAGQDWCLLKIALGCLTQVEMSFKEVNVLVLLVQARSTHLSSSCSSCCQHSSGIGCRGCCLLLPPSKH